MKGIELVFVGRLKKKFWIEAYDFYFERLKKYFTLKETIIRDAPSGLSMPERVRKESAAIGEKLSPQSYLVILDERGSYLSSVELAARIRKVVESGRNICFVIGGAYGMDAGLMERAEFKLGIGPMTLPHELARIILMEQLYRAASILNNTPYHHG